ncbi:MAG: bifunctional oligoribonuclease/PAP phosphatase NrnA, partial [Firmicutes bacterium]|nr:bifunctional oligoribonuclease/PAP phosphatase NrnA [Bacillota bacterium]
MLDRFAAFLERFERILLTTHENPDGDGIGAMVGLAHYLRARNKQVRIVVAPALPHFLAFLDSENWIEVFEPEHHQDLDQWCDAWVLVDASEPHRLGPLHGLFQAAPAVKACLDHHLKETPQGFDQEFTDSTASASAELVFGLAAPRMALPLPMATALYAGIVDDTGNFRFSNATARVHRAAAELIEAGAEPARVYQNLYHQGRPERLKLFAKAFENLQFMAEGRYGLLTLTQADLKACGALHDDMEGLVNKPLELRGVEVACLLHELPDGRIKASLRSR